MGSRLLFDLVKNLAKFRGKQVQRADGPDSPSTRFTKLIDSLGNDGLKFFQLIGFSF